MPRSLPENFIYFTHEGLFRATIQTEAIYSLDAVLARLVSNEKMFVLPRIYDSPCGPVHQVIWTSDPPRRMSVAELVRGSLVFTTQYHTVKSNEESWVSPCFAATAASYPLRCAFDFAQWAQAGLRLFLGVNFSLRQMQLWVFYEGQIYRPPFGNIFEGSCQLCVGHSEAQLKTIFHADRQPDSVGLAAALQLLSDGLWNHDTFNPGRDIPILNSLVRFDSGRQELPMLPPLEPAKIKQTAVAANKDLASITLAII